MQKTLWPLIAQEIPLVLDTIGVPVTGGQSNLVWRTKDAFGRALMVKLFRPDRASDVFPNSPEDEFAILSELAGHSLAPHVVGLYHTSHGSVLIYEQIEGLQWTQGVSRVASVLRRVHDFEVKSSLRHAENGSHAIEEQGKRLLSLCSGDLVATVKELIPQNKVSLTQKTGLIHGDPVAGNMIVQGDQVYLIDWQCPAIGDPMTDLALFLSPAMQTIYLGRILNDYERAEFLEVYGETSRFAEIIPWYTWRMLAYCLWRWQSGIVPYKAAFEAELAFFQKLYREE